MKKNIPFIILISSILAVLFSGCDKYLDVVPDARTELDSKEKVYELLVSTYPEIYTMGIFEHRTDNVHDNGPLFSEADELAIRENYYWQPNTEAHGDNTQGIWDACYSAIANTNIVLDAVDKLGNTGNLAGAKGEALVARAFNHFTLLNVFSMAYNGQTSGKDLGVPYSTKVESKIGETYSRPSVSEDYALIEKDLLEGLPLIDDQNYSVPKYHFNIQSANAFAAKFFLYKEDWDKAIEYATKALGNDPAATLRDIKDINESTTSAEEWGHAYIDSKKACNYMIIGLSSTWFRSYAYSSRYGHTKEIVDRETLKSPGPWGSSLPAYDRGIYNLSSSAAENQFMLKYFEFFEYTNVVAGIGFVHVMAVPFTSDETLLYRAEALVMKKEYDLAAKDLSDWYVSKGGSSASAATIAAFYEKAALSGEPVAKPLHPKFAIEEGMQTYMLQAVLHARRIETVHSGQRWEDIKRYGIEITHNVFRGEPMTLTVDDPRRAIQLPGDVLAAGMTPNPQ